MNKKLKAIRKKGLKHQPDYGKKSHFTKDQFVSNHDDWWHLVHKLVKDFEKTGKMYVIYNISNYTYLYRTDSKHIRSIAFTARGIMGLTNVHDHLLMDIDAYWTMIRLFDKQRKVKAQCDLMKKAKEGEEEMKKRLKKKWVDAIGTANYMLMINPTMAINFAYFDDVTRKYRHCQAIRKRLAGGGLLNTADGWAVGPAKITDILSQPATYTVKLTDVDGSVTELNLRKYFTDDDYADQVRKIGVVHDFIATFLVNLTDELVDQFNKAN